MKAKVEIRYEAERGCGYRTEGGLYMMGGMLCSPCGRLPIEMTVCSVCNQGIKPAKGWTWIRPQELFGQVKGCSQPHCGACYVSHPPERAGLIWIGSMHYETPAKFLHEARSMGISRRIPAVPKDFKAGETVVFLAHRQGIERNCPDCFGAKPAVLECETCDENGRQTLPAIFAAFKPTHIEKVVGEDVTEEEVEKLEERGITPVIVRRQQQELDLDGQERHAGGEGDHLEGQPG